MQEQLPLSLDHFFLEPAVEDQIDNAPESAALAVRIKKLELIRVAREANLRKVFPALEEGNSYHIISSGDIDAVSFLTLAIERYGPLEELYASTWTMSRQDCELLDRYLRDGLIRKITFFVGEYFAKRETSVYASIIEVIERHAGRIKLFRNHCKLLVMRTVAGLHITIEGSANFTTNPRTEQTVITPSRELFFFYRTWFEDLLK
jgi:hypothetical protein